MKIKTEPIKFAPDADEFNAYNYPKTGFYEVVTNGTEPGSDGCVSIMFADLETRDVVYICNANRVRSGFVNGLTYLQLLLILFIFGVVAAVAIPFFLK